MHRTHREKGIHTSFPVRYLFFMIMDTWAAGVSVILICLSLVLVRQRWRARSASALPLPPGPRPLPLIGNTLQVPAEMQWLTYTKWASIWGEFSPGPFINFSHMAEGRGRRTQVTLCTSSLLGSPSSSSALQKPRMKCSRSAPRFSQVVISHR